MVLNIGCAASPPSPHFYGIPLKCQRTPYQCTLISFQVLCTLGPGLERVLLLPFASSSWVIDVLARAMLGLGENASAIWAFLVVCPPASSGSRQEPLQEQTHAAVTLLQVLQFIKSAKPYGKSCHLFRNPYHPPYKCYLHGLMFRAVSAPGLLQLVRQGCQHRFGTHCHWKSRFC